MKTKEIHGEAQVKLPPHRKLKQKKSTFVQKGFSPRSARGIHDIALSVAVAAEGDNIA